MKPTYSACYRLAGNTLFMVAILLAAVLCTGSAAAASVPQVVAEVNGEELTQYDLEEALNEIMPARRFHGGFSAEKMAPYRKQALENMIENELFYQEALSQKLKVDKALVKEERDKTITRLGDKNRYKEALKQAGLTDRQYQKKLGKKYLVEQLLTMEVEDKAKVSDEEVAAHYEQNKQRYMRPEARRLTHILLSFKPTSTAEEKELKRKKAEEVLKKITAGEDMSMLAWDYSEGPYRVKGGDLGLVHQGRLEPELEEVAFELQPGQVSDIVETLYGFHIVRVEAVSEPEQLDLEDVAEKIRETLSKNKEEALRKALVERLRAQARIATY